jgi:c-di-GMP-binding flagellar brake protein YcgR
VNSSERKWKRLKVDMRVRLRRLEEAEEMVSTVRSYELSEGGMSLYSPDIMDVGTPVLVGFSLSPGTNGLRLRAVVKNRRGFRCGLEFVDLPPEQRSEIVRYLESVGATES